MDTPILVTGPETAATTVLLGHGSSAAMDSPFMERMAGGLGERGVRVVRFEFPYMAQRRQGGSRRPPDRKPVLERALMDVVERFGGGDRLVLGGKSLGGRIASMVADGVGARAVVCLGYPFHSPGRPEKTRTQHLAALTTPALIVQGTRDRFGLPQEVAEYQLSERIRVHWIEHGDHGFKPTVRSGRTETESLDEAVDAVSAFVKSL